MKLISATFAIVLTALVGAATEQEVTVINPNGGISLAGTLALPEKTSPKATVILASGSGQQDRDETILGHKPFKVISDSLTAHGFAVLRMDDRGVGGSQGDPRTSTIDDNASDIRAGVAYLDSIFPKLKTGIIGHSEGGLIAVKNAVADSNVDFIITLAAPAWRGDSIVMSQSRAVAEAMSGTWEGEKLQRKIMDLAMSDSPREMIRMSVYMSLASSLGEMASMPMVQKQINDQVEVILSPWYRSFLLYNPTDDIPKVTKPWLALNGDKDMQVLPENLKDIAILNPAATTVMLPDHNHLFQKCRTGMVTEYASIPEDISPETISAIISWLDSL